MVSALVSDLGPDRVPARAPCRWLGAALLVLLLAAPAAPLRGQESGASPASWPPDAIDLTLQRMVEYALESSYRMRHLNLAIERSRLYLKASRARLKSRVDLEFSLPTINYVSEARWDPDLRRNVIQRENSRRLEAELSVRQPVILFGFPTNGYLSLNSRMYRLTQKDEEEADVRYYNRSFVRYTQPLFQANELRNDLEEATLDLETEELEFYSDVVGLIDNAADDYFELFEISHQREIRRGYVETLETALDAAEAAAATDPDRAIDADQIRVELANAREDLAASESRFRLEASSLKTQLRIPRAVVIRVDPSIELARVPIDVDRATEYARELTPRMRRLDIRHRENEIHLDNRKGRGGFELDVSLSYGREMQDEAFREILGEPENSYTVDVEGSLPIWDWGQREAEIHAQEISLKQSLLRIEQTTADIRTGVQNEVRNVTEYEDRAFAMRENLTLSEAITRTSLDRYRSGTISVLDLLQSLRRHVDTAENFLDAYLGWRRALQRLQEMTYYDWEERTPLLDAFGIRFGEASATAGRR